MWTITSTCLGGGYKYARTKPPHPKANSNGLYPLHRVIMENSLGRILSKNEVVHHKDGNKENDSIENLIMLNRVEHSRLHQKKVTPLEAICGWCSKVMLLKPKDFRARSKKSKSGEKFCSRSCGAKFQFSHFEKRAPVAQQQSSFPVRRRSSVQIGSGAP